jgi:hypothetical protein
MQNAAQNGGRRFAFGAGNAAQLAAQLLLLVAVANALQAFMQWAAALLLAGILVYLFSKMVDLVLDPSVRKLIRVLALASAALLATLTVGMSASTLWIKMFAQTSVANLFQKELETTERALSATNNLVASTASALAAWQADAKLKADLEYLEGGTCPRRAASLGKRGPVFYLRRDDERVAFALAKDLDHWATTLNRAIQALKKTPKATVFNEVSQAMTVANIAIEAALPLTKNGAFSEAALRSLNARKAQMVAVDEDGTGHPCGDASRIELIERSIAAVSSLAQLPALPRMAPSVDLTRPEDVTVRGWLRSANLAASLIGLAGNFNDDPLWRDAKQMNGSINRESLSFIMAIILELAVVLTKVALTLQKGGSPPFASDLVANAGHWISKSTTTTWRNFLAQMFIKSWCNLFYREVNHQPSFNGPHLFPTSEPKASVQSDDSLLDSGFMPMRLGDDPKFSARVKAQTEKLLPYYVPWGDVQILVIPQLKATDHVLSIARHLANHAQLKILSNSHTVSELAIHPTATAKLALALSGSEWQEAPLAIYEARGHFSNYLDFLAAHSSRGIDEPEDVPVKQQPAPLLVVPRMSLRAKLAKRGYA